jgi:hypothetical protein
MLFKMRVSSRNCRLAIAALCAAFVALFSNVAAAQLFVPVSHDFPNPQDASLQWGDYDSDGDLDLIMNGRVVDGSGTVLTSLFRNDNGSFVEVPTDLIDTFSGVVKWGDYDNDNDLDLLVTGWNNSTGNTTRIYRNDGGDTFTDIGAGILGVSGSAADWGDFDNDGDLDLLLNGLSDFPTLGQTLLLRNDGNDTFTEVDDGLQNLYFGSAAWADYDNDQDLDILMTGDPGFPHALTIAYRNDGDAAFTQIDPGFFNLYSGEGRWGDFDQDGDPDIIVDGTDGTGTMFYTMLYRNDGGNVFTDIEATITGAGEGSMLRPIDCDNDGALDVAVTATANAFSSTRVFLYSSGADFTDLGAIFSHNPGALDLGDFDNDGDLDLLTALIDNGVDFFRNESPVANTPPQSPTALSAAPTENSVTLNWLAATDAETQSVGLTYNVRIGTTPADPATGYRKIVGPGNAWQNTTWTIYNLPGGIYYWSVQAIDNNYAGSAFASEKSFSIPGTLPICGNVNGDGVLNVTDAVDLINHVFKGGPPPDPYCNGDASNDGSVNISDAVYIVNHIFKGGPLPGEDCCP